MTFMQCIYAIGVLIIWIPLPANWFKMRNKNKNSLQLYGIGSSILSKPQNVLNIV